MEHVDCIGVTLRIRWTRTVARHQVDVVCRFGGADNGCTDVHKTKPLRRARFRNSSEPLNWGSSIPRMPTPSASFSRSWYTSASQFSFYLVFFAPAFVFFSSGHLTTVAFFLKRRVLSRSPLLSLSLSLLFPGAVTNERRIGTCEKVLGASSRGQR